MEPGRLLEGHAHQLSVHKVRNKGVRPQLLVHPQDRGDALGRGGLGVPDPNQGDPGPGAAGNQHYRVPGMGPVDLADVEGIRRLPAVPHEGGGGRAAARQLPHRHGADLPVEQEKSPHGHPDQQRQALQQEPEPAGPMHLSGPVLLHGRASINILLYHRRKRRQCQ